LGNGGNYDCKIFSAISELYYVFGQRLSGHIVANIRAKLGLTVSGRPLGGVMEGKQSTFFGIAPARLRVSLRKTKLAASHLVMHCIAPK